MPTVLITDDAAFMRMQLKDMISKLGYEVVGEADNGRAAVEQYEKLKPDLVTMDITMPEVNGVEATKQILSMNPSAKIIMCSAMGQQAMVIDAIQAGAKDFVVKPFTIERIEESIKKVLG